MAADNQYDLNMPVITATGAGVAMSFASILQGAVAFSKLTVGVDVWWKPNGMPVSADVPGQNRLTDIIPGASIPRAGITSIGFITAGSNCVVQGMATVGEQS